MTTDNPSPNDRHPSRRQFLRKLFYGSCGTALAAPALFAGCDSVVSSDNDSEALNSINLGDGDTECTIPRSDLASGAPKDAIPAVTDPKWIDPSAASYLRPEDRVLGLRINDETFAVPHNVLWWHEIINLDRNDHHLAITYCPLTGSGLVFDRSTVEEADFGVSGLLYRNNLIMYDRRSSSSLWSQMMVKSVCGQEVNTPLPTYPVMDMTWEGWRSLHPSTRVISTDTGFSRDYRTNPYGGYGSVSNESIYYPMPDDIDQRRPVKERVLGIPQGSGGIAFPFGALAEGASPRVVNATARNAPIVLFWNESWNTARAYRPGENIEARTFEVRDGEITDVETESRWNVNGQAFAGPLTGRRLSPVRGAYIAFWFAWAAFQPRTDLWTNL
jgi:hypothetical protein